MIINQVKQEEANWVDAIDEGKIVRVSEEHARREGLPIIRRPSMELQQFAAEKAKAQSISHREKKGLLRFEEFRKPLKNDNALANELIENFHWLISQKRKDRRATRKHVAESIGVNEYDLKMLENGILVSNDFILINKLEKYYNINLRKNANYNESALKQALASKNSENAEKKEQTMKENLQENKGTEITGTNIDIDWKI